MELHGKDAFIFLSNNLNSSYLNCVGFVLFFVFFSFSYVVLSEVSVQEKLLCQQLGTDILEV